MKALIIPFVQAADDSAPLKGTENGPRSVLVASQRPDELVRRLALELPAGEGRGEEGLLQTIRDILENSVNTWDQGFMDKLYASTNPVCSGWYACQGKTDTRRLVSSRSCCWPSSTPM